MSLCRSFALSLTLAAAGVVGCRTVSSTTTAPGVATGPSPEVAALVGARSPDWLLEPVAPFVGIGESLLDDASDESPHGLLLGRVGERPVVLLDRRVEASGEASFVVEAVLELPTGSSPTSFAWTCRMAGRRVPRVIALVPEGSECARSGQVPAAAWRVEPDARRFAPLAPEALRCEQLGCEPQESPVLQVSEGGARPSSWQ